MNTKEKYMISENSEMAEIRINQINAELITRINRISAAIGAFGVPVSKPMVLIALKNPSSILDARHKAFAESDAEHRKAIGDEMFAKLLTDIETPMMDELVRACNDITGGSFVFYNGMSISNPAVMNWFDIDDIGHAYIPDAVIESIHESLRKYIKTTAGKKLRDLQIDIADKLEQMHRIMSHIKDDDKDVTLDFAANAVYVRYFPGGLFEYKESNGYMHVIPRNINFDPVNRDEVY